MILSRFGKNNSLTETPTGAFTICFKQPGLDLSKREKFVEDLSKLLVLIYLLIYFFNYLYGMYELWNRKAKWVQKQWWM